MIATAYALWPVDSANKPVGRGLILLAFVVNCAFGIGWQFAWDRGWFDVRTLIGLLFTHAGIGLMLAYLYWRGWKEADPQARSGFEVITRDDKTK